jgi:hypothetical protein
MHLDLDQEYREFDYLTGKSLKQQASIFNQSKCGN